MQTVAQVFGRRVRALRVAKGWTQEDLARATKMDAKHIGAIERGEKTSSFDAIQRLSGALKVQYYELFIATPEQTRLADQARREITEMARRRHHLDAPQVEEFLKALRTALAKLDPR